MADHLEHLDKNKYQYVDPDNLPKEEKDRLEQIPASYIDIQYIRRGIHSIIGELQKIRMSPIRASCQDEFDKIEKFIEDFATVKLKNGGGKSLFFPRVGEDGFEQRLWDRFSFKGWRGWLLGVLALVVTLLTILNAVKEFFK